LLQSGTANIDKLKQEFEDLGGVISQEGIDNAADFNDAMFRLRTIVQSIRDKVILALLPAFTEVGTKVSDFAKANRLLIEQGLTTLIETVVFLLSKMTQVMVSVVAMWSDFVDAVGSVRNAVVLLGVGFIAFQLATSSSLLKVIASVRAVGTAATIANAKLLLVPLAIAAAVAGVLLVLDELHGFITGKDSLIGRFLEGFQAWRAELGAIKILVDAMLLPLEALVELGERLGTFAAQVSNREFSKGLSEGLQSLGASTFDRVKSTGGAIVNFAVEVSGANGGEQLGRDIVKGADQQFRAQGLETLGPTVNGN